MRGISWWKYVSFHNKMTGGLIIFISLFLPHSSQTRSHRVWYATGDRVKVIYFLPIFTSFETDVQILCILQNVIFLTTLVWISHTNWMLIGRRTYSITFYQRFSVKPRFWNYFLQLKLPLSHLCYLCYILIHYLSFKIILQAHFR